jgi:hypothetical protein
MTDPAEAAKNTVEQVKSTFAISKIALPAFVIAQMRGNFNK